MNKFDVFVIILGLLAFLLKVAMISGAFYLTWLLITGLVG